MTKKEKREHEASLSLKNVYNVYKDMPDTSGRAFVDTEMSIKTNLHGFKSENRGNVNWRDDRDNEREK